ncbi:lipoyl(octanoyl) transferase LipB [uncultured Psychrobacter sp.]|uniref:lipoyl(octanoyl) transferase LipB n=1 Tax=uncultured Psychrobacter sp. TaxID=259303 RepID=UPI002616ADBE|nr:lipoyl(octanoyl) transferase LipB [uncultured Psychrobacter sp.]
MQPLSDTLISRTFADADYVATSDTMRASILKRIEVKQQQGLRTPDELWIVDHNDVYTLGQASKPEHILQQTDTPIIQTDRGGQVTWHGHGQLVIYWLFDLDSLGWSVRNLVSHAEQALEDVINDCLKSHCSSESAASDFKAKARRDAPGVYIYSGTVTDDANTEAQTTDNIMLGKIASLGFKIKHGFSYHGLALNINCDLSAFNAINPCGYAGMQMLRLADFVSIDNNDVDNHKMNNNEATLSYKRVSQMLIDNIAQRHAGDIALRPVPPKS